MTLFLNLARLTAELDMIAVLLVFVAVAAALLWGWERLFSKPNRKESYLFHHATAHDVQRWAELKQKQLDGSLNIEEESELRDYESRMEPEKPQ